MPPTSGTEIVELDTGVYARLQPGLTNGGIIIGDNGVLIIDSLRMPSFARDLIDDVRHITNKPIQYVIDTHAHWDHSWGNEEFPDATIIGHDNCYREMVDVEWNTQWRDKVIAAGDPWSEEAHLVKITPPTQTFETSMRLHFGGREIELRYLGRAHTSGDTFIYLPTEKILFTGDVAQDGGIPYFGDSYPNEWPNTDDLMVEIPAERFVSGHGPIGGHDALIEARDFIHLFIDSLKSAIQEDRNERSTRESIIATLTPQFSEWRGFDRLEEHIPDLYGKLKHE